MKSPAINIDIESVKKLVINGLKYGIDNLGHVVKDKVKRKTLLLNGKSFNDDVGNIINIKDKTKIFKISAQSLNLIGGSLNILENNRDYISKNNTLPQFYTKRK
jgi:hypothetical protein